jgi:hypothetical protein
MHYYLSPGQISGQCHVLHTMGLAADTMGDFKVGFSVSVYCTKCTLNTGVNTNFEITHWD